MYEFDPIRSYIPFYRVFLWTPGPNCAGGAYIRTGTEKHVKLFCRAA